MRVRSGHRTAEQHSSNRSRAVFRPAKPPVLSERRRNQSYATIVYGDGAVACAAAVLGAVLADLDGTRSRTAVVWNVSTATRRVLLLSGWTIFEAKPSAAPSGQQEPMARKAALWTLPYRRVIFWDADHMPVPTKEAASRLQKLWTMRGDPSFLAKGETPRHNRGNACLNSGLMLLSPDHGVATRMAHLASVPPHDLYSRCPHGHDQPLLNYMFPKFHSFGSAQRQLGPYMNKECTAFNRSTNAVLHWADSYHFWNSTGPWARLALPEGEPCADVHGAMALHWWQYFQCLPLGAQALCRRRVPFTPQTLRKQGLANELALGLQNHPPLRSALRLQQPLSTTTTTASKSHRRIRRPVRLAPVCRTFRFRRYVSNPLLQPHQLQQTNLNFSENINGPSVLETPRWLRPRLGRFYMYSAHHTGDHVRLAYADELDGSWTVFGNRSLTLAAVAGVCHKHVASPDVHVESGKRLRMYFHCPTRSRPPGCDCTACECDQQTFAAISVDGLSWTLERTTPVVPTFYFKRFTLGCTDYGLAKWRNEGGVLFVRDFRRGFRRLPGILLRMRHGAVHVCGTSAYLFWTAIGDKPEHLLWAPLTNLTDGDWVPHSAEHRALAYPTEAYEGAYLPPAASTVGMIARPERAMRDPAVLALAGSDCNTLHLLYAAMGERTIAGESPWPVHALRNRISG